MPRLAASAGAHIAQLVEHVLGKDEVTGSSPVVGSIFQELPGRLARAGLDFATNYNIRR